MSELRTDRIVPKDGLPAGSSGGIIQVKQVIHSSYIKYDSDSWSKGELSGGGTGNFEITITPTRSDSKILVSLNSFYDSYQNQRTHVAIFRGASTNLGGVRGHCEIHNDQGRLQAMLSAQHLDSPATTSAVTYTVQAMVSTGSFYLGLYNNNKWLTAMEVTG